MTLEGKRLRLGQSNFVSMSQAAKMTPYTMEYLSLLARKGRIKAVKISRDWLTTEAAIREYVREQEGKHKKFLKQLALAEKRSV